MRLLGTKTVVAEPGPPFKTAQQMTDLCCEPTAELQCREKVTGPWAGYPMEDILGKLGLTLDAQGRDQNGRLVKIALKQRTNPCGKVVERYLIKQKDCCEEVEPLVYDTERSVRILAPGTSGVVYAIGGRSPYLWKVRGTGFSLDGYSLRDGWTDGPAARIFAHSMACGTAPITVEDGCTIAAGSLRSTVGGWIGDCYAYYYDTDGATQSVAPHYYLTGTFGCVPAGIGWSAVHAQCYGPAAFFYAYRWNGSSWVTGFAANGWLRKSEFDFWAAKAAAAGCPAGIPPTSYAPNGPGDIEGGCSGATKCQFIC